MGESRSRVGVREPSAGYAASERLGESVGRLSTAEQRNVDDALALVLGL
jgi:hypothetical protein